LQLCVQLLKFISLVKLKLDDEALKSDFRFPFEDSVYSLDTRCFKNNKGLHPISPSMGVKEVTQEKIKQ